MQNQTVDYLCVGCQTGGVTVAPVSSAFGMWALHDTLRWMVKLREACLAIRTLVEELHRP